MNRMHRGSLELDCRDFNNSGVDQCFVVRHASEPQPCKPATLRSQQLPAPDPGAVQRAGPGRQRGQPVRAQHRRCSCPQAPRAPFIPASAGGGGCNLGLNCLTLGSEHLTLLA